MSDFIFLRDPCRCPSCGKKGDHPKNGFCGNCNTRLFSSVGDFHQMEANGLLPFYWAFTKDDGWKYRDHFIVENAKPLAREVYTPKLPKDYGTHTTPEAIVKRGGKTIKRSQSHLL